MDRNVESHHKITIFKKALPVKEHVYKLSNSAALRESRIDCKRIQGEIGKKKQGKVLKAKNMPNRQKCCRLNGAIKNLTESVGKGLIE